MSHDHLSRHGRPFAPTSTPSAGLRRLRLPSLMLGSALLLTPMVCLAGDGSTEITDDERAARIFERLASRFDADSDGTLTAEEVGDERRFARMDRNGDSIVTADDFVGMERKGPRHGRHGHHGHRGGAHMMLVHMAQSADTDQDGKVSRDEMHVAVAAVDTDGDGFLSPEELKAHRQAVHEAMADESSEDRHPRRMRFMDKDGDERLAVSEVQSLFDRMDRDGDGFLTETDRPKRERGMRRGPRGGFFLHLADTDNDDKLTQAEWNAFLAATDADGDGTLTRAELESLRPEDAPRSGGLGHRQGPQGIDVSRLSELFTDLDADADGDIEGDEWPRRSRRGHREARRERSRRSELF